MTEGYIMVGGLVLAAFIIGYWTGKATAYVEAGVESIDHLADVLDSKAAYGTEQDTTETTDTTGSAA